MDKLYRTLKGTTYSIGKQGEPHDLQTVQRVDFQKKSQEGIIAPERGNQEA